MEHEHVPAPEGLAEFVDTAPVCWKHYLEAWLARPAFREALHRRDHSRALPHESASTYHQPDASQSGLCTGLSSRRCEFASRRVRHFFLQDGQPMAAPNRCTSSGRAAVSKTEGWRFAPSHRCHFAWIAQAEEQRSHTPPVACSTHAPGTILHPPRTGLERRRS